MGGEGEAQPAAHNARERGGRNRSGSFGGPASLGKNRYSVSTPPLF